MLLFTTNASSAAHTPGIISSGSLRVDLSLVSGGLPPGEICEILGPPGGGKTTLCHAIIAGAQRNDGDPKRGVCAFVDVEGGLETSYAARCGVDLDRLLVCRPEDAEAALDIVETLAESGEVKVLVVDSATALLPRSEIMAGLNEGLRNDSAGLVQIDRLLAQRLPRLKRAAQHSGAVIVFTSQMQAYPGPWYFGAEKSAVGLALKLHAAVRLEIRICGRLYLQGQLVGSQALIRIAKPGNVKAIPTNKIDIMYNNGICRNGEIFDLAYAQQIIQLQGSGYCYLDMGLGSTREDSLECLKLSPRLAEEIEQAVRQHYLPPV